MGEVATGGEGGVAGADDLSPARREGSFTPAGWGGGDDNSSLELLEPFGGGLDAASPARSSSPLRGRLRARR